MFQRADLLILIVLAGCAKIPPAGPSPRNAALYDVVVAVASAERQLESVYELEVEPAFDGVWIFTTTRSHGSWEEGGALATFDSEEPSKSDPWPVTLQHAISGVPTAFELEEGGAAVALMDPKQWKKDALGAIYRLDLPVEAMVAGEALLHPQGLVADLVRNFPGTPPEGEWRRNERIAGLTAARVEQCTPSRRGGLEIWQCAGTVEGPEEGPARLHEVASTTMIEVDRHGLKRLETTYSGTLVMLGPAGQGVLDRPIAGKRLVQRR